MSECGRINAGMLEAFFERRDGRITHSIRLGSGPTARPILRSHEGRGENPWPESPPLQQLLLEERPGDVRVALLIGMAGSSHWSMSCTADPNSQTLTFDVAVRIKRPAHHLGSLYDVAAGATWNPTTGRVDDHCEIDCDPATTRLETERGVGLAPLVIPAALPTTVQWRYVFARV